MRYEYPERDLYNQLLYFRKLWDVDGAAGAGSAAGGGGFGVKPESGEEREKVNAVKEWNRERFGTCTAVVEGYLGKCGRVWVQMEGLFGFAMR